MKKYIIAFDENRKFHRLFKSNSLEASGMKIVFSCDTLREGYDYMITINDSNRMKKIYSVAIYKNKKKIRIKIFRTNDIGMCWQLDSTFNKLNLAKKRKEAIFLEYEQEKKNEEEKIIKVLKFLKINVNNVPASLSETDKRYINYIYEKDKKSFEIGV